MSKLLERLPGLLKRARELGATEADAIGIEHSSTTVRVRLGEVELVEQAREKGFGFRAMCGLRSAVTSTSDLSEESLEKLVETTVHRAQITAEVEHAGLPDGSLFTDPNLAVDTRDDAFRRFRVEDAIALATEAEEAALGVDDRLTNSEGAECSFGLARVCFANTHGFIDSYEGTRYGIHAVPIAEADGEKVRDWWYTAARHLDDLKPASEVGRVAGERAARRVGAIQPPTGTVPVVFDPSMAARLVGALAGAINGYSVFKGASYLCESLGKSVAASRVTLVDDATAKRGLASRPFDGEGLESKRTVLIGDGVLQSFILDTYSGRKLEQPSTRNASRSLGDAPLASSSNLLLEPGETSPEDIIGSVKDGLYITELFGFGVNTTTGDYSQGAVGMWIRDGVLDHPVHEFTIAGKLATMLDQIEVIGSDVLTQSPVAAPTIKIASMTVAGA